jgi:hypothetical protein
MKELAVSVFWVLYWIFPFLVLYKWKETKMTQDDEELVAGSIMVWLISLFLIAFIF